MYKLVVFVTLLRISLCVSPRRLLLCPQDPPIEYIKISAATISSFPTMSENMEVIHYGASSKTVQLKEVHIFEQFRGRTTLETWVQSSIQVLADDSFTFKYNRPPFTTKDAIGTYDLYFEYMDTQGLVIGCAGIYYSF